MAPARPDCSGSSAAWHGSANRNPVNGLAPTHGMSVNFGLPLSAPVEGLSYEEYGIRTSGQAWNPKRSFPGPLKVQRPPSLRDNAAVATFLASDDWQYMSESPFPPATAEVSPSAPCIPRRLEPRGAGLDGGNEGGDDSRRTKRSPEEPGVIELQVFRRVECHDGEPVGALEAQALQAADQAADPVEVLGVGGGEPGRCVGRRMVCPRYGRRRAAAAGGRRTPSYDRPEPAGRRDIGCVDGHVCPFPDCKRHGECGGKLVAIERRCPTSSRAVGMWSASPPAASSWAAVSSATVRARSATRCRYRHCRHGDRDVVGHLHGYIGIGSAEGKVERAIAPPKPSTSDVAAATRAEPPPDFTPLRPTRV